MEQFRDPLFVPPSDPNTKIWRYMDFPKYISMLEHNALFFARADMLGDPHEGSLPKIQLTYGTDNIPEEIKQQHALSNAEWLKWHRKWTMVNCWTMNQFESLAMWNSYTVCNESLAIQSTYTSLRSLLSEQIQIGMVYYIDYENEPQKFQGNLLSPVMHKMKEHGDERELRAINFYIPTIDGGRLDFSAEPTSTGEWQPVDLNRLIEVIKVSPRAAPWFTELLEGVSAKYGINKPILPSALQRPPRFSPEIRLPAATDQ